ncbi:MAG: hypothetical protein H0X17_23070, partial [Deltaproteobacteria bacterium]|nr:hypothetical protein [Deltaproteobacteria bacterium]
MSFHRSMSPLPVAVAVAFGIALAPGLDSVGIPPTARWLLALLLGSLAVLVGRRAPAPPLALVVAALIVAGAARG